MPKRKQQLVQGVILALALWPAVQMVLVARYGVNPWKLGGWGMYSAPQPETEVQVGAVRDGREIRYDAASLPPGVRRLVDRYAARRAMLGRLQSPGSIADAILASDPRIDRVEIDVAETVLNPRTDRLERRVQRYEYGRKLTQG